MGLSIQPHRSSQRNPGAGPSRSQERGEVVSSGEGKGKGSRDPASEETAAAGIAEEGAVKLLDRAPGWRSAPKGCE